MQLDEVKVCGFLFRSLQTESSSPCRKDSVGMKKAAVHIPSRVISFKNQKLQENKKRLLLVRKTGCVVRFVHLESLKVTVQNFKANKIYTFKAP